MKSRLYEANGRELMKTVWLPRFAGLAFVMSASATTPALCEAITQQRADPTSGNGSGSPPAASQPGDCTALHQLPISTAEHNRRCVEIAGARAAYRDGVLTIRIENGTRKIFRTERSTIEAGAFGYALMGYYATLHLFIVSDVGIDSGNHFAIDGKTGNSIDFGTTFPYFSPSGRWIMVDESVEGDPNLFKLLQVNGSDRITVWSSKADPTTLSATTFRFVRWKDDQQVVFTLGRGKSTVLLNRAEDGHWHYDLADDISENVPE